MKKKFYKFYIVYTVTRGDHIGIFSCEYKINEESNVPFESSDGLEQFRKDIGKKLSIDSEKVMILYWKNIQ